ncbi:MAG TPA: NADH-ubiquinone oxidoreductase-F iron-sulfur binding region domain-containing protein [Acidimicrobiales bacterium]|jgi:NADH-quinone oxidoreductase subunit F|nr:NADH-ubiquinone oxidoreductase-F iron-sulfur binding region domain-containing protein [Acidimicrobiales bacterium]
MDLHFGAATASPEEQAALDAHIGPACPGRRDLLLPALHAVADAVGWLSTGAINEIGRRLDVAPADVHGVASFYAAFSFEPRSRRVVHVCEDLACMIAAPIEPPAPGDGHAIVRSPCLGLCERAPAMLVSDGGRAAAAEPPPIAALPQAGDPSLVLLRRVGAVDPTSLDDYRAHGGYVALRRADEVGPLGVIREVTDAGLAGRGGAAFPTGRKWQAVASQPVRPHYLVCNADESEPGTFKDRVLLEGDPYAVIEAMTIAAFATGCERGYVYLRHEYVRAADVLARAIAHARRRGYLGRDVMGFDFTFDIEIRRGAGAYICGEETAIFNSIEGHRGEPRNKPPFPTEVGLFGAPTVVNNVETLVNVLPILVDGAAAFAATGTAQSTGTKLFCLSGHVRRPGVYEVPFGITLGELLARAGGLRDGRALQAVLLGGAAGGFATPADLGLVLSNEAVAAAGLTLGSGVVMVLDDTADLGAFLARIAAFFRDESCGQCVPCRVGTVRQEEIVHRLHASNDAIDVQLLRDVARVMRDASICGLGQTASNAIESAIDRIGVHALGHVR